MALISTPLAVAIVLGNVLLAYWLLGQLGVPAMHPARPATEPIRSPLPYREYTLEDLRPFNGAEEEEILLAIEGRVYDVSSSRHYYGPGASYAGMAGRDASRALATNTVPRLRADEPQAWDVLDDLTAEERETLDDWQAFFAKKYPRVGALVRPRGGTDAVQQ